jgi:hypothetical protein
MLATFMDNFPIVALFLIGKIMQGGKALASLESCVVAVDCHSRCNARDTLGVTTMMMKSKTNQDVGKEIS